MQHTFDTALIFCPEAKTGGPEALHQLAYQIARHGGSARMVYYAPFSRLELEGDTLRCHSAGSPMPEHFAHYHPQVLTEAKLGPNTLLIFPEPLSKLAAQSQVPYRRALWWLSLDNAMPQNPELMDEQYRQQFFMDAELIHFYQSDYALSFLRENGASQCHPLSDYTDQTFIHQALITSGAKPTLERRKRVCYFPSKGEDLAKRFISQAAFFRHQIDFIPLRDMTKAQVRDTLFDADIYLDFGNHPGKDRLPREAAIAKTVVLLHAAGAARHFLDHPLEPSYLFTEEAVASGDLRTMVDVVLDDPEVHLSKQRLYRDRIILERERFDLEVRSFFFTELD